MVWSKPKSWTNYYRSYALTFRLSTHLDHLDLEELSIYILVCRPEVSSVVSYLECDIP